jgi:hypothetical protein
MGFWRGNLKRPFGRPGREWSVILIYVLRKQDGKVWIGLNWLGIGAGGGMSCI